MGGGAAGPAAVEQQMGHGPEAAPVVSAFVSRPARPEPDGARPARAPPHWPEVSDHFGSPKEGRVAGSAGGTFRRSGALPKPWNRGFRFS